MTICVIDECQEQGSTVKLGQIPGAPALTLCRDHSWDLFWSQREKSRKLTAAIYEANPGMQHTPGWTYAIRLANGNVKLGYTEDPSLRRLKTLSGKPNDGVPVQILAVVQGGESYEALIHERWSHLRVAGQMEQFHPSPDLLAWIAEQGIDPEVSDLEEWTVSKHERGGTGSYAREMFGDIREQMSRLQQGDSPDLSSW